jgi:3-hydroxyisobutyrate dehydrogenase-like beta-hydroxyacid dehydrogenase
MRIAFLGTGRMGAPMAGRLLDAGHEVNVWNRSKERAEPLGERGATVAATPGEAVERAEIAITMLADEDAVRDVVLGSDGAAERLGEGSLLIEMSTIGPDAVRGLRDGVPDVAELIDAPVLGSIPEAEKGELKIFVGGPTSTFERVRGVLGVMGSPRHAGDLGAGAALKLVVNSTLGAVMVAVGEALALARALGVDEEEALDVLSGSYVGGAVKSKRRLIEGTGENVHFRVALAAKDLRLVSEAAKRAGVRLEGAEASRRTYEEAVEAGFADADYGAVIPYLRDRAS